MLDTLSAARNVRWEQGSGPYLVASLACDAAECLLVKPLTYVNRSGEAARIACERHGVAPIDLLVVVDDVHLPPGEIRLRQGGSTGGHNGLASLVESLGTHEVPRLRVGIGAPRTTGALVEHVLSPFTPEEELVIRRAAEQAAVIAEAFGGGGYAEASAAYSRLRAKTAGEQSPDSSSAQA